MDRFTLNDNNVCENDNCDAGCSICDGNDCRECSEGYFEVAEDGTTSCKACSDGCT